MKSKGFVITTDAFIALTLLFLFTIVSLFFVSNVSMNAWNSVDLSLASRDEAAVLEKSLSFESAVLWGSAEPIVSIINASPEAYCFEVALYSESDLNTPVLFALKSGCVKSFSEISVSQRSVVVNSGNDLSFFVARVGAWYK